jgi:5-methylcytosine-specific restriction endonuclease McrA
MKNKILALRKQGKSYRQISTALGCSKGTISYHCGIGQKKKTLLRQKRNRLSHVLSNKIHVFKKRALQHKSRDFQRERTANGVHGKSLKKTFSYEDVLKKFGKDTKCYLTGRPISLLNPKTYQFDHIVPASKGGPGTIDNLGIVCKEANQAKANMSIDDFIIFCKDVLIFNGHSVS